MSEIALPKNWLVCRFDSIAKVTSGKTQKDVETSTGVYPIYGSGGSFGRASAYLCEPGTTVIGRKGTINAPIFVNERFWNVDTAFGLSPISGQALNPRFLYYFCRSFDFKALDRSTTIPSLSKRDIEAIPIPLPPLPEQKRIVAKIEELLSELEAGEENLRAARKQLGVYRRSLLKQAFEGKLTEAWRKRNPDKVESPELLLAQLRFERGMNYRAQLVDWEHALAKWTYAKQSGKRPAKPSEPTEFPEKEVEAGLTPDCWAVEQIGNCITDSLIGLVRSAEQQSVERSGISYIKMDRIDMDGNIDIEPKVFVDCTAEEVERFKLRQGDILFNTRNSVELVGKVGIVRRNPESDTVYNNNLMRIRLPECLDPVFVGLQLCAQPFRQRMDLVKKATTSVAAVYAKDFGPLPIALCSLPEQQEIVRILDAQFEVIEQNEREIDAALKRSEALRQSILHRAFTGRLVPQDPADEPASELLKRIQMGKLSEPLKRTKRTTQ